MFAQLVSTYHLHPIVDHFTIALLTFGIAAEILAAAAILLFRNSSRASAWSLKLQSTSLMLMIGGSGRQRPVILLRRRGSRSALGHDDAGSAADSRIVERRARLTCPTRYSDST